MGSVVPDVGLNLKLYASKTINGFLKETMEVGERGGKATKLEGFIRDLEVEKAKIEVFKRELPLSMHLLGEIVNYLKEELERSQKVGIFAEFMPTKGKIEENIGGKVEIDSKDKKSWMSSAQLWSHSEENSTDKKAQSKPSQKNTSCGFMPFKGLSRKDEKVDVPLPDFTLTSYKYKGATGVTGNSTCGATGTSVQSQSQLQQRKMRRCWSPELHRRFISALQQLGGAQVATPKQIREMMKVDGLTNDEVKSHLQKYRLHTRRTPTNNGSCKDQQSTTSQQSTSQSGSPTGPLQLAVGTRGAGESCDDEDERSDSYDWKL
ncbi:myb-like transcription factor family protein [Rhynchospora pubera]|uniref:Myb-like transcription factor family protein n=1 Tax=Rhynchospora pubera TaxID=906938 RepID=A0AAV8FBB3_9POAL|nr:myb-like transcription factor family protein [Rhynchospora pubera]